MDRPPASESAEVLITVLMDELTTADLSQVLGRAEQIMEGQSALTLQAWHVNQALEEFGKGEINDE